MSDPRFSIIIPLFNKASYIEGLLRSLKPQLLEGDEILLVDDKSSDGGAVLAQALLSPPWGRPVAMPENGGPATARNAGARLATCSYLLFLDADDIAAPYLLVNLRLAVSQHPAANIFAFGIAVEAHGASLSSTAPSDRLQTRERPLHAFAEDSLLGQPALCTASSTCVTREAFLQAAGFQEGLRYCEDPELWARLSAHYPIVQIDRNLTAYRDVSNSLSYGLRGIPGAVNPYVKSLLGLSSVHGGPYRALAISLLIKNFVFSHAAGAHRSILCTELIKHRRVLGLYRCAGMQLFLLLPRSVSRVALKVRSKHRRSAQARGSAES